jgi:arabinogalactan endo-1,4-beta-galactosidase
MLRFSNWFLAGLICRCLAASAAEPTATTNSPVQFPPGYIIGADISWVQANEDRGAKYSDNGVQKDILQILKDHGFNYIRLRVFNDPTISTLKSRGNTPNTNGSAAIQAMRLGAGQAPYSTQGYCDLAHTIKMAKRVKAAGMGLLIDFHYSDSWADPQKQFTPTTWFTLPFPDLVKATHDWTRDAIQQMKEAGCQPDMVQVGNEITPGMMNDRPDGGGSTRNWAQLGQLLKAGIAGVKDVDPKIQVMLHIDKGGDNAASRQWLDAAIGQGLQFDILGESCYARWQGRPESWKENFHDLAQRYPNLKFLMAEVDAQAVVANEIMLSLPNGRGLGTFIWEPTANNAGQALFDNRGAVIPDKMAQYDQVMKQHGPTK